MLKIVRNLTLIVRHQFHRNNQLLRRQVVCYCNHQHYLKKLTTATEANDDANKKKKKSMSSCLIVLACGLGGLLISGSIFKQQCFAESKPNSNKPNDTNEKYKRLFLASRRNLISELKQ